MPCCCVLTDLHGPSRTLTDTSLEAQMSCIRGIALTSSMPDSRQQRELPLLVRLPRTSEPLLPRLADLR